MSADPLQSQQWVLPSRDDPVVAGASELIGGPVGRRAVVGGSWWTPMRVVLVLVVLASLLGVLADEPCRKSAWSDSTKQYTHACYSDVVPLFWGRGLADHLVPYFSDTTGTTAEPVEYPVLTGLAMWFTSLAVPSTGSPTYRGRLYYDINAGVALVLAMLTVWATALLARRRVWDAAMVAVAPGLILTATINWDLWAVALTAVAMLAWSRRYEFSAGLLLGLAVSAKFYPLFLLGPLLVLCVRAARPRAFTLALLGTVLSWVALNVPIMVTHWDNWLRFYQLSRDRGADYGSIWLVITGTGHSMTLDAINKWGMASFAALCLAIAVLALLAPRRPRFAQLAFLVVASFVLTNKVYSPQYVLWLIPLAVLARPRWRDFIWWQGVEVVYFLAVWWYIHGFTNPDRALPATSYYLVVGLHLLATAVLCGFVVRDVWLPRYDVVRRDDVDDPSGGVLDGASDRITLGPWARRQRTAASGSDQHSSTVPDDIPTRR
ncbi:MAG: hypothetical protein WAN48_01375 [Actinomycetes bacterium]